MKLGGLMLAAGRVRFKKKNGEKKRNPAAPEPHHEIHSRFATATISRRHATKPVLRLSPNSSVSIDPGFVEIGLEIGVVQLS